MRLARLLAQVEQITRDGAREDARRELNDAVYREGEASLFDKLVRNAFEWLLDRIAGLVRVAPGGIAGVVVIVALLVLLAVLLRLGLGPLGARNLLTDRRRGARAKTAAEYRAEAESLAAGGRWKEAVRARLRATIRELEERGVLDVRAGRTAGEVASEAGAAVPAIATDLREAARVFDEIWYGDRPATEQSYRTMAGVDDRVRGSRLATARP